MVARVVVVLALLAGIAAADDKPWVAGVSEADQNAALALYQKGNELFEAAQYKEALAVYEQALALWDHPAIRYNAAVCLFNLDRPVEAYENMTAALRFGDAPLGKDLHAQGVNYKKLLAGQIAEVEVQCKQSGVSVSFDGKPLLACPGAATRVVVAADPHEVVASRPGYQTERRPIASLRPGEKTTIVLELQLLEGSKWKPWAVVAGGAVISAAGALLYLKASSDLTDYERAVDATCPCASEAALGDKADLDDRARLEAIGAYSALAIGAATLVTGVVLVVRNRGSAARVTPAVGADRVGVTFSARW